MELPDATIEVRRLVSRSMSRDLEVELDGRNWPLRWVELQRLPSRRLLWVLGNGTDGQPDASRMRPRTPNSRTRRRTPTAGGVAWNECET